MARRVRRIRLPTGKVVELVVFDDDVRPPPVFGPPMQECVECGMHRVVPVHDEPVGSYYWLVELYCPDCKCRRSGTFDNQTVRRFDNYLTAEAKAMGRLYRRAVAVTMEAEADLLRDAFRMDLVGPEDFAPRHGIRAPRHENRS